MITHPYQLQSMSEANLARHLSPEAFDIYVKARSESFQSLLHAIVHPFCWIKRKIARNA